jgi:glycosyltransferase involved in cell wall biosynthesis
MTRPPAPICGATFSVVIPCRNDAELLDRCLNSFAAQLRPADEIIVVDNGSTDHTRQVALRHGARVVDEPRRGITWATKAGFDAAVGDILVRVDADVHVAPDYLQKLQAVWHAATAAPGRRVVGVTGSARFDLDGVVGEIASSAYLGAYRASVGSALGHHPLYGTNCSIRADWWARVRDEVDFSDTLVHDDMHLSFAVGEDETVWFQPDLVVGMDDRALRGLRQIAVRFYRGFYTMVRNWRDHPPHRRLARRGRLGQALKEAM